MNKLCTFLFTLSLLYIINHVNCHFTKEEENALNQFRGMVQTIVYEDYMLTDDYLITWLRAKKLNLGRAKVMLEKNLKWRKEQNIDNIMHEDVSRVEKCIKVYHGGVDREGRPIAYAALGAWDVRKCALAGQMPVMTRYVLKHFIEGPARVARSLRNPFNGANVTQSTIILDLSGFNLRQGGCLACLPLFGIAAYNYETYFPAATFKYLIINTPQIFNVVLDFVKPIAPASSKAITLFGHNKDEWSKGLDKFISKDQLPVIYGGQRVETPADRALYSTN